MAPSNTSSATGRPTRMSARAPAKPISSTSCIQASAKSVTDTKAGPSVTGPSKRQATQKADSRKRTKVVDSEEDQEEEDQYDDDGSDMDDFEDTSYSAKRKSKPNQTNTKASRSSSTSKSTASKKKSSSTTASTSRSTTKSATLKSTNPDLLPAPSKTFSISPLVIPRPKNPVADAIQPETLEFMRDLKLNNDREYFQLNEARWLAAKLDFQDFIRMVKEGLLEADPDVMDQEPKDSMMRIYRDVRFSNDKSPYKKQLACFFSKGGKKSIAAGYYFGTSSGGETFVGCGVWDPSGPALLRIRQGIANDADRFKAILETDAIKQITGGKSGLDALEPGSSQLKTGPSGFERNHPMIEYLKRKCFAIGRRFTDEEVVSEGFLEKVLTTFDACVDLVHILNEWIG